MPFKIPPRKYKLNRKNPRRGDLPFFNVKGDAFRHIFAPDFNTGTENVEKSTEMCVCFQLGICHRGASCRYVHGYKELRDGKLLFKSLEDVKNDFDGDDDADADADAKKSEEAVVVEEEAKVEDENTPSNERCEEVEETIKVEETIVVEEKKKPFKERRLTLDNLVFMALQRKIKRRKAT